MTNHKNNTIIHFENGFNIKKDIPKGDAMSKLALGSIRFGECLIFTGKLQLYWFLVVFRYFICGGIYPATAAVIHYLIKSYEGNQEAHQLNWKNFLRTAQINLKQSNQVGFLSGFIGIFLYVDLRIALVFTRNIYVTGCLGVLLLLFIGTFLYLIPSIVRYRLTLKDSFRQAFFLLLVNIPNTIVMLIGMGIAIVASFYIPLLVLVPVPLFLLVNSWFAYQGMRKLEKANEK